MRANPILIAMACACFALAVDTTAPAAQDQPEGTVRSDPCHFYRARAWGQGIGDYTTEMLWACEAIAARRAAAVPLGPRLQAMANALDQFRDALVDAGSATFATSRNVHSRNLGVSRRAQHEIAERTGVLAALEAIQTGF